MSGFRYSLTALVRTALRRHCLRIRIFSFIAFASAAGSLLGTFPGAASRESRFQSASSMIAAQKTSGRFSPRPRPSVTVPQAHSVVVRFMCTTAFTMSVTVTSSPRNLQSVSGGHSSSQVRSIVRLANVTHRALQRDGGNLRSLRFALLGSFLCFSCCYRWGYWFCSGRNRRWKMRRLGGMETPSQRRPWPKSTWGQPGISFLTDSGHLVCPD